MVPYKPLDIETYRMSPEEKAEFHEKRKKENEELEYEWKIFNGVLFFSRDGEKFMFPTPKEYILDEFANGTIEHVGGESEKIRFKNLKIEDRPSFPRSLWNYLQEQLKGKEGEMMPQIREAAVGLLEPWSVFSLNTDIYIFWQEICREHFRSKFSLSEGTLYFVENNVIPSLSEGEIKNIEGIGKSMRPFIEEDLKYIKEHYHW